MHVVVGCPVRNRAWILPFWFVFVEQAFAEIGVKPTYAFAVGTSEDNTYEIILERAPSRRVAFTDEAPVIPGDTRWSPGRFTEMTAARNELLELVRAEKPDLFLSLDSDIMLSPKTMPNLIASLDAHQDWAAIGGKLFMQPMGTACPSYAFNRPAGGLAREDSEGVFQAEIIMALKLMRPDAYNVDYKDSGKGEDVGWSLACRDAGLRLGWDGRVTNKHVMITRQLYEVDPRCGY